MGGKQKRHRGWHDGTVYKRTLPSGRVSYYAEFTWGRTPEGKRFRWRSPGCRTQGEARQLLAAALHDHQEGRLPVGQRQRFDDYLVRWLDETLAPQLRPRTLQSLRSTATRHLLPAFRDLYLDQITPQAVAALYSRLLKGDPGQGARPLAPGTVENVHKLLRHALGDAVDYRLLGQNPVERVSPPRVPVREMQALTLGQAKRLLQAARGEPLEALFVLALTTGLRQGELLALRRSVDLDLTAGRLQVARDVGWVSGQGFCYGEPKSRAGRRNLPLPPVAVEALRRHLARQDDLRASTPDWQDHDLVFCTSRGTPWMVPNLSAYHWRPLLRKAGLPALRFHDLRHTCATLLYDLGVDHKTVQAILGHARIGQTMDLYTHAVPTKHDAALDRLGDALDESTG